MSAGVDGQDILICLYGLACWYTILYIGVAGLSCCCVSGSDVAAVTLRLYLLLMVDYLVLIQVIFIRTVVTKTTVHIQLVVVKAF